MPSTEFTSSVQPLANDADSVSNWDDLTTELRGELAALELDLRIAQDPEWNAISPPSHGDVEAILKRSILALRQAVEGLELLLRDTQKLGEIIRNIDG